MKDLKTTCLCTIKKPSNNLSKDKMQPTRDEHGNAVHHKPNAKIERSQKSNLNHIEAENDVKKNSNNVSIS